MSEPTPAVNGTHTTHGRPNGYSSLTPFLALTDPAGGIAFYTAVFGARVVSQTEMGGLIVHAELDFGLGRLQLGAAQPAHHLVANDPSVEDVSFSLAIYCPNVDEVLVKALDAGATLREPAATFVSGDRFTSIRDPFGIRWSIMTRVEDLSDEESDARVKHWAAQQAVAREGRRHDD